MSDEHSIQLSYEPGWPQQARQAGKHKQAPATVERNVEERLVGRGCVHQQNNKIDPPVEPNAEGAVMRKKQTSCSKATRGGGGNESCKATAHFARFQHTSWLGKDATEERESQKHSRQVPAEYSAATSGSVST